jgi:hypothetical protein
VPGLFTSRLPVGFAAPSDLLPVTLLVLTSQMAEQLKLRGTLIGHNGWVTQIATTHEAPDMILSASRGTAAVCVSLNCRQDHHRLEAYSR